MKIIIFSTVYFPLVAGAEVAMKEITDRISDIEFHLICARVQKGLPSTERIGNVTVHRVGFGHPIDKFLLPFLGTWRALMLPDSKQIKVVLSLMASYGGFTALVYSKFRPDVKFLLNLQEGDPLEHYAKRAGRLRFLHGKVFERADAVTAISRFLADWALKMGFKGTPEVVPNGADIVRFSKRISMERRSELRTQFGFKDDDVALVTASRLSLKNGIDDLIRSLTHLPTNYKVLIAGDGEDHEKLMSLTAQKGLTERVVCIGKKSHEELPEILQSADIFVRASLSEGLGNSFLEALAAGLPIVGTPVGGIPDFLEDGLTGVFCQPRDPQSIAAAVKRIQEEPGLRERIVLQGGMMVAQRFGWDEIASRTRTILMNLETV